MAKTPVTPETETLSDTDLDAAAGGGPTALAGDQPDGRVYTGGGGGAGKADFETLTILKKVDD